MRCVCVVVLALAACRERSSPPEPAADAAAPPPPVASVVSRHDAGPSIDALPLDPACDGPSLALLEAATDARCAIDEAAYRELREAPGLTQAATRDGAQVVFALVNGGPAAIDVPIRFDDRAPSRAFTAVAQVEGDAAGVFALPPPVPVVRVGDAGVHVHSARIRLPPGGRAAVRLTIALTPIERLDRRGDGGLALRGPVIVHVGQALSPLPAGDPAAVRWGSLP